jgi:membrane protein
VTKPGDAGRIVWAGARTLLGAMRGESLRLRAMSLTYISLFALVPALVVAFSFMQAFGQERLWRVVHEYVIANLAVGARASIEPYLDRFVRNAHATSAGLVGGAILIASSVGLFSNIERAVNDIWAVKRLRPFPQRLLIYWAGLTLGPVFLAGSLALAHAVGALASAGPLRQLLARLASILLSCALFTLLFLFVPSTRVRFGAAAAGGLVAGFSWELAKGLYTFAVAKFFRYHAVYGSVAAVPIFLLWLYVSWTLVLFGARVSFVVQHARLLLRGHAPESTALGRELLAARALLEVALAYREGRAAPDPGEVAIRLDTFGEPVREVLGALRSKQLVMELAGGGLVPGRPLALISLADVRRAIAGAPQPVEGTSAEAIVSRVLEGAEGAAAKSLSEWTLAELCDRVGEQRAPAVTTVGRAL